jgi:hypothetical protein
MKELIPLYSFDGALGDWITEKRLDRLVALNLVTVVRTRKGKVKRAVLRQRASDPKLSKPSDYAGTRYSYQEHLESGHAVWTLRRLGKKGQFRSVFLQVVIDCSASER